ncbi:MAG: T9SS type A sorting domain-containing protein [Bacteroidetes bacterium]|nr:MAG: T9SS type A sorting domain-containing protein [Bacteroidota bacterium]
MKRKYTLSNKYNSFYINFSFMFIGFVLAIMSTITLYSEITNPGFESWTDGNPDNWRTTNNPPTFVNVTQTIDAHSGSYALEGEVKTINGFSIPVALESGSDGAGFPENTRPAALHGWYKFTSISQDIFMVTLAFRKGEQGIGAGQFSTTNSTGNWTEFVANIVWGSEETPDEVLIGFQLQGTTGLVHEGSLFIIDDLAYGPAIPTGVEEKSGPNEVSLLQNYPNPFNQTTTIRYNIGESEQVNLSVYDLLGQEVATLANGNQSPGNYEINFDSSKLPQGTYFYKLQAGASTHVKVMDVVR